MRRQLALLSALALVPAMIGPLQAEARSLVAPLCGGASLSIPVAPEGPPGPSQGPCCAKGCHAGSCRKRLDRPQ
ncbi:hypothetical protein GCM10011494_04350 [Novosphingobium endophyticum]|uniref:Uncharacterized protein n=1 Tax=Novosphingobium endophyticum TaxID=1955250 RepID=A0A916TP60_9SPHN|nr:hypothetical protein [Novosphingobium endophyticum]GGB89152.1 hypothetical protein GCM10011494_04350 [Novosphingobium endophyticum]